MSRHTAPVLVLALAFVALAPAVLEGACTVSATGGVSFGSYSTFDPSDLPSTGTISYSCTLPVNPPAIKIDQGGAGSFAPRQMSSGANALAYNLYLDASGTSVWGDGSGGTSYYQADAPADGQNYDVTVYGRIFAQQNVKAGSYSDSLTVTIEF